MCSNVPKYRFAEGPNDRKNPGALKKVLVDAQVSWKPDELKSDERQSEPPSISPLPSGGRALLPCKEYTQRAYKAG